MILHYLLQLTQKNYRKIKKSASVITTQMYNSNCYEENCYQSVRIERLAWGTEVTGINRFWSGFVELQQLAVLYMASNIQTQLWPAVSGKNSKCCVLKMAGMKSWYGLGKKCDNTMDNASHCAEWGGWIDSYFPIFHNLFMWRHIQSFPAVANRIDNWKILTNLRRQAISSVSAVCPQQQLVYGGVAREGRNFSSISDQVSSLLFNAMLGLCLYGDISYFVWSYALIDRCICLVYGC